MFFGYGIITDVKLKGAEKIISLYCIILAILFLLFKRDSLFLYRLKKATNIFVNIIPAVCFSLIFNIYEFFEYFPLRYFNYIVFYDDYPQRYAFLIRALQILKQGGIFGWDSKLLGGYPTVFEINDNYSFIFLPFSIFGYRLGFHIMLLFFYLLFPFLVYFYIYELFRNKKIASTSLYISSGFNLSFFKGALRWGMVDLYIGVIFFILALVFTLRFKKKKKIQSYILAFEFFPSALCSYWNIFLRIILYNYRAAVPF